MKWLWNVTKTLRLLLLLLSRTIYFIDPYQVVKKYYMSNDLHLLVSNTVCLDFGVIYFIMYTEKCANLSFCQYGVACVHLFFTLFISLHLHHVIVLPLALVFIVLILFIYNVVHILSFLSPMQISCWLSTTVSLLMSIFPVLLCTL